MWPCIFTDTTNKKPGLSRAERCHKACLQSRTIPASSFLSHMGEADLNLNHCGLGPLGATVLHVWTLKPLITYSVYQIVLNIYKRVGMKYR